MAKVSLRIYNREIERLIEQGNLDEAVAHCYHILKTFPKHLDTYRLLGKAYLEARRYTEAVDVFGRLLMAVPDDFVAHVGLSIIRDEENKLDDAIWHMERAFEVQPSNAAIQGELQRLYGRRDGMEPPKVRMTRGALARIYVQGELHPQAVSEIRSVLAEDPQRADMQVLLAQSYFKSGQRSDASDLCNQLLKRYPYCFDANRIMVDLLPGTAGTAESTQVYRMRVGELDPYAIFSKGSIFNANEVPDASVNMERLEYTGEESQMQPGWGAASLGSGMAASVPALGADLAREQPDWLSSAGSSDAMTPLEESAAKPAEIPDFLRAAGWNESKTPEQPTSIFDEQPGEDDLVPADLPDWLKGQVPVREEKPIEPASTAMSDSFDSPDWLKDLGGQASESFETPQPEEPASSADTPDWLSGLGGVAAATTAATAASSADENVPDWLQGLGGTEQEESAAPAEEEEEELAQPANLPDWLKGAEPVAQEPVSVENLGASAQEQDDAVAWLESLAAKHGAKPEELVTDPSKRSETPPDWVQQAQNIGQQAPAQPVQPSQPSVQPQAVPDVQSLGATAQEQDDAVAWLESLAAKHGAKPEELVTDPNKRSETPPEWVQQAQTIGSAQPAQPPAQPAETEWVENAQNVGEDFFAEFEKASAVPPSDATGMWLRDLEEKESAGEQPAVSSIEDTGDLPEWLKPTHEEESLERGEIPEWLNEPSQSSAVSTPQGFEQTPSDLPNWLNDIENETAENIVPSDTEKVMGDQDLSEWLNSLDNEPGLELDPELLRASERPPFPSQPEQPVEAVTPPSNLPNWLNESEAESEQVEEEEPVVSAPTQEPMPVTLSADLPDWLQGVDEETDVVVGEDGEDLPPWLHREQFEAEGTPQQPKPTTPADWHPISDKPAEVKEPVQQPVAQKMETQFVPPAPEPKEQRPVAEKKKAPAAKQAPARQRKAEGSTSVSLLTQAKSELDRGDIPEALVHYDKLIKKGKHLEEIISSLNESLYRYPVEVSIWQALGDAYMRANRLKEALDAYNKAEELIR